MSTEPRTELDARYGDPDATATPWEDGRRTIASAPLAWVTTVRPDGRPHMTPLHTVWRDDAVHFCTGPEERKARNLVHNRHCIISTGTNALSGLDVMVEGDAERITDEAVLRDLADAWVADHGEHWRFGVVDGAFRHEDGGAAYVFRVAPRRAFGFSKVPYSQTRWTWT